MARNVVPFRSRHVRLLNIALFAPKNAIIRLISARFPIPLYVILISYLGPTPFPSISFISLISYLGPTPFPISPWELKG